MIDPEDKGRTKPILRCPKCNTLYGPNMEKCGRCGGELEPAPGPKRLCAVVYNLPPGEYSRDVPFAVGSPNLVDL